MKIAVLVKEVPDAAVQKRIDPATGRLDRSGEKNLNPYDTHAIEAAVQLREGGAVEVEDIVAITVGPESAVRALHKAVSLGADRSIHLSDDAIAGSDVVATGYALAKVIERENPDLVLLPAVSVEPSGLMAPIGDQTWINWLNFFLNDYYSSGVSTCGCGKENFKKWFKAAPLPLTWNY